MWMCRFLMLFVCRMCANCLLKLPLDLSQKKKKNSKTWENQKPRTWLSNHTWNNNVKKERSNIKEFLKEKYWHNGSIGYEINNTKLYIGGLDCCCCVLQTYIIFSLCNRWKKVLWEICEKWWNGVVFV